MVPHDCSICLMFIPVITYSNADTQKLNLFKDNKNKSGIYRWVNIESGKSYIGSSVNLWRRFNQYYSLKFLTKYAKSSIIYKTLLKQGYSKFRLEILEYCEPAVVIKREQYYLDLLKPDYNILKTAGSSLGFKHTKETLAKIAAAKIGNRAFKGKNHTLETRINIAAARKGKNFSPETLVKLVAAKSGEKNPMYGKAKPEGAGKPNNIITILDLLTNERTKYDSINEAAKALGIRQTTISLYFSRDQQKPYKGRYIFEKSSS